MNCKDCKQLIADGKEKWQDPETCQRLDVPRCHKCFDEAVRILTRMLTDSPVSAGRQTLTGRQWDGEILDVSPKVM